MRLQAVGYDCIFLKSPRGTKRENSGKGGKCYEKHNSKRSLESRVHAPRRSRRLHPPEACSCSHGQELLWRRGLVYSLRRELQSEATLSGRRVPVGRRPPLRHRSGRLSEVLNLEVLGGLDPFETLSLRPIFSAEALFFCFSSWKRNT